MEYKKEMLSKKLDNLRGLSQTVYELVKLHGTTKNIVVKTGKSRSSIGKVLKRLIQKGYIKRLEHGCYRVVQKNGTVNQIVQNPRHPRLKSNDKPLKSDTLRLHDLQIKLRINSDDHNVIRRLVLKKKMFKNIRSAGNNDMWHFNVNDNIGLFQIGRQNIHLTFPSSWEVTGEDIQEIADKMYDEIEEQISYLENLLRANYFKDGRINFEITKNHIALVNNGVVTEMKLSGIKGLSVYDSDDGKQRFLMDWSKGKPELEAVHTVHSFDDADKAKYFMNTLKDGKYEDMHKNTEDFFNVKDISLKTLLQSDLNIRTNLESLSNLLHKSLMKDSQLATATSKSFLEIANVATQTVMGLNKLSEQNKYLIESMQAMSQNINALAGVVGLADKKEKKRDDVPAYIN